MCCFSGTVTHVAKTRIFARPLEDGTQAIVYAMDVGAPSDVAMILPLPVPPNGPEDAVRFVALAGYEDFFDDLAKAFPAPATFAVHGGMPSRGGPAPQTLAVHRVGDFVASYVPHPRDFARLDRRFRLPEEVLGKVPAYGDWGFAVFQLAKLETTPRSRHPMAFVFPRRHREHVFFPTLHVHDGHVPERARFDHTLFVQWPHRTPPSSLEVEVEWTPGTYTPQSAGFFPAMATLGAVVDLARAKGLVHTDEPAFSTSIGGLQRNQDVWLALPG